MRNHILAALVYASSMTFSYASVHGDASKKEHDEHSHEHAKEQAEKGKKHEHDESEEEGSKNVGPAKGITSFSEDKGFTLSKEAHSRFDIQTMPISQAKDWTLPSRAFVFSGKKISVFRVRDGFYKEIEIKLLKKMKTDIQFSSQDLKNGDLVVVKGAGFLKVAQIDATSGEVGHSH